MLGPPKVVINAVSIDEGLLRHLGRVAEETSGGGE